MFEINRRKKFKYLKRTSEIKAAAPYMIYGGGIASLFMENMKLEKMESIGWNLESMEYGLRRLIQIASNGDYLYPVYSSAECKDDKKKKHVNVICFPAVKPEKDKPFIILCAGGAYMNVCSAVEGYPVAAKLNELGYTAFVLTYRVNESGIFPKPLDDLATALKYIQRNAEKFKIDPAHYIVSGFSAGGNLTALWGTDNHGYASYGLPKPAAMFPIYPAVNSELFPEGKLTDKFMEIMLGKTYSKEKEQEYRVDLHMSNKYPPCYIVCCKDDATVPYSNSERLTRKIRSVRNPSRT